jgi:hypothetical protein
MPQSRLAFLLVSFFISQSLLARPGPAGVVNEALKKELAEHVDELQNAILALPGDEVALKKIAALRKRNAL